MAKYNEGFYTLTENDGNNVVYNGKSLLSMETRYDYNLYKIWLSLGIKMKRLFVEKQFEWQFE